MTSLTRARPPLTGRARGGGLWRPSIWTRAGRMHERRTDVGRCRVTRRDKNSPKWAEVARHGKNCAVEQKRESCAKVALRNIAIFWWDYAVYLHWSSVWGQTLHLSPVSHKSWRLGIPYGARLAPILTNVPEAGSECSGYRKACRRLQTKCTYLHWLMCFWRWLAERSIEIIGYQLDIKKLNRLVW